MVFSRLTRACFSPQLAPSGGFIDKDRFLTGVRNGDVVLFAGTSVDGRVVRAWSDSSWSHVGLVMRAPQEKPLLLHSEPPLGVQAVDLAEYCAAYPGEIFWRPLLPEPLKYGELLERASKACGTPYTRDSSKMFRCLFGLQPLFFDPGETSEAPDEAWPEKPESFFCSSLVAWIYQSFGLLRESVPADWYQPSCFSEEEGGTGRFRPPWKGAACLGPTFRVTGP